MPEIIECRYCGMGNPSDAAECHKCGASLDDGFKQRYCDRCGIPLHDGVNPVGQCITCNKTVYMCDKHKAKIIGEEILCNEHESDCFIATAVYGTSLNSEINRLRLFRDDFLLSNYLGRFMVFLYYEISPVIARRARSSQYLRELLRRIIVVPALKTADSISG
ncbi:MAG: CFI-box-CTERM domain-containing protein [Candidatus Thorarchaeota archaeon]